MVQWSPVVRLHEILPTPKRMWEILPRLLLSLLFGAALLNVFLQAGHYGVTVDEFYQETYGRAVLAWYQTQGRDTSFLTALPPNLYLPEHGAIFEVLVAEAEVLFGPSGQIRAIVTGLAGALGVVAIALCGFELGGWWAAFLAAASLWLYPRYFGAMFNNSKDIPFTAAMTYVLWAVLALIRQWEVRRKYLINSLNIACSLGFAAAIRVTALLWYPLLILLLLGWWVSAGRKVIAEKTWLKHLGKQAIVGGMIAVVSLIAMIALWPYVALDPVPHLYQSILLMSHFPWNQRVLFAGQLYPAADLPWSYVPAWLAIGSPPVLVLFACIGALIVCIRFLKERRIDPPIAVICLALFFPLGLLIVLHPVLYDGLRQFLFLLPSLILLAIYGFLWVLRHLAHQKRRFVVAGFVIVVLASQVQVAVDMYRLHPYEYMYFSPLVGGVPGANGRYDMDYWGICNKPAAEWLAQHYQAYTSDKSPTIDAPYLDQVLPYLPASFQIDAQHPDFYISTTRFNLNMAFPSYQIIHTEGVQGYVGCVVKVRPAPSQPSP